ncbi:hypothetical protein ACJJI4_12180 [Microbulbifer sp. TRSA002]|uniref:hypothetical protein n=1 Tax=Microbulbifer sp. TRSA002 TaxID=3243382 RepID=UPI0040399CCC
MKYIVLMFTILLAAGCTVSNNKTSLKDEPSSRLSLPSKTVVVEVRLARGNPMAPEESSEVSEIAEDISENPEESSEIPENISKVNGELEECMSLLVNRVEKFAVDLDSVSMSDLVYGLRDGESPGVASILRRFFKEGIEEVVYVSLDDFGAMHSNGLVPIPNVENQLVATHFIGVRTARGNFQGIQYLPAGQSSEGCYIFNPVL